MNVTMDQRCQDSMPLSRPVDKVSSLSSGKNSCLAEVQMKPVISRTGELTFIDSLLCVSLHVRHLRALSYLFLIMTSCPRREARGHGEARMARK